MIRRSSNLQLNQIFDSSSLTTHPSTFNEFGNFIYKDHVTRMKYNLDYLKTKKMDTMHSNQTIQSLIKTHKQTKSTDSMGKIKKRFQSDHIDEIEIKKRQLLHFLEHLEMMNKIRKNRNHIVSGVERIQKRKSVFPSLHTSLLKSDLNVNKIDTLKQQIRKQVNDLSTELFREYMENTEPYRMVFNELSTVSSKGALNTDKIKQIKKKIEECTKRKLNTTSNNDILIKKRQLDTKENNRYQKYFSNVTKQIDEEIHLKINHQAAFNWKHGKRQSIDDMLKNYQLNASLDNNNHH